MVKQLFIDRVTKSNGSAVEQGERIKPTYINKLFASAISNLSKPFKAHDKPTNENVSNNIPSLEWIKDSNKNI